jgi:WD40 repeat protein
VRHGDTVEVAAFDRDAARILTASWDGEARLSDARTGARLQTFSGHHGEVFAAALSVDGRTVVTAGADGTVRVWDAESGRERRRLDVGSRIQKIAVSSDAARVLSGTSARNGRWRASPR